MSFEDTLEMMRQSKWTSD